jgi:hypothetical protein
MCEEVQKINKAFNGGKSQKDCFTRWLKKYDDLWGYTHDYPKPGEPTPDFPEVEWQLMAELEHCCRTGHGFTCHCGGLLVDNAYRTKDPISRRDVGRKAQSIAAKMDNADKFVGSDGFAREFKKRKEDMHQNEISSRNKYETIVFRAPIGTKEELSEVVEFTRKHSSERLESNNALKVTEAEHAIPLHESYCCKFLDEEATMAHLKSTEQCHAELPTEVTGLGTKFHSLSNLNFLGEVAKLCRMVQGHYVKNDRPPVDKVQEEKGQQITGDQIIRASFGNVEVHVASAHERMTHLPKSSNKPALMTSMVAVLGLDGKQAAISCV